MDASLKKKRRKWPWILLAIIAIIVLFALVGKGKKTAYIFDTEVATNDSVTSVVTATGIIQPVYKVTVGTKGSGIVEKLHVDYNDIVHKGQLLAELDKSEILEAKKTAQAHKQAAQSSLNVAQRNFERVKALFDKKAATLEEYDQAESNLENAKSNLVNAQSSYENTLTQLRYAEIYSPIDGIIIKKNVEEGQTVQGAYSVPDLFTIAQDMKEIQVEAQVDEADIGKVKKEQPVAFSVDAYTDETFHGIVQQIRMDPSSNNNVVTYTVIIRAANPDEKLFPGMTANVRIITDKGTGLRIPFFATQLTIDSKLQQNLEREGYSIKALEKPDKAVWIKNGKQLTQVAVTTGAKDNVHTIATGIKEGDTIVSDIVDPFAQHTDPLKRGN